jgi:hypothetical protein
MTDNSTLRPAEESHEKEQPATTSAENFFNDLSALRLDGAGASAGAIEILAHIPVRKPNRQEFFRVHPKFVLDATVFTNKEESETYFIMPVMRPTLVGEARPVLIVPAINRQGTLFVWPVPLPGEDGRRNTWTETAQEAMRIAKESWVRLMPDMGMGAYRIYKAEGRLSDPVWPEKSLEELLEIAFRNRVIDSEDHPVVRRLRGLV